MERGGGECMVAPLPACIHIPEAALCHHPQVVQAPGGRSPTASPVRWFLHTLLCPPEEEEPLALLNSIPPSPSKHRSYTDLTAAQRGWEKKVSF